MRISWSALQRWQSCRMQAKLHREGHRVPISDRRVFIPGTVADLTMRKWLELDDPQGTDISSLVEEVFQRELDENDNPIKWKGSKAQDMSAITADVQQGMRRLQPWLEENVLPYRYQPESRGYGVVGIPDDNGDAQRVELFVATDIAVMTDEDKFRLYDLKFTKNENYIRGKTLGQLTFYKIAWAARLGVPLSDVEYLAFITPMTSQLETGIHPDKDDVRYMMSQITGYAQSVWRGDAQTKSEKDSDCTYRCEVRLSCPLFTTDRKDGKVSLMETARRRAKHKKDGL